MSNHGLCKSHTSHSLACACVTLHEPQVMQGVSPCHASHTSSTWGLPHTSEASSDSRASMSASSFSTSAESSSSPTNTTSSSPSSPSEGLKGLWPSASWSSGESESCKIAGECFLESQCAFKQFCKVSLTAYMTLLSVHMHVQPMVKQTFASKLGNPLWRTTLMSSKDTLSLTCFCKSMCNVLA